MLLETLTAYQKRDPAARSKLEIFLLYPGVHAIIYHRIAHWLYCRKLRFLARCVSQWSRFWTGIEIHPGATIGRRLVIDHGTGIVIGETAELGDDILLYQGVTLGGTGKDTGKRHPTLGDDVVVGAGAKVLGPITLGNHVKVGAGAVVLKDVPDQCTVVGNPGRIVRGPAKRPEIDLNHGDLPDPMQEKIQALYGRLVQLEQVLTEHARRAGCLDCPAADCPGRRAAPVHADNEEINKGNR